MIDIPPTLRRARTVAGETAWLDALPELVDEMASRWSLEIGRSLDGLGVNALVIEATTTDDVAVVLKIAPPGDAAKIAHEATVLRLAVSTDRPPAPRGPAAGRRRARLHAMRDRRRPARWATVTAPGR